MVDKMELMKAVLMERPRVDRMVVMMAVLLVCCSADCWDVPKAGSTEYCWVEQRA